MSNGEFSGRIRDLLDAKSTNFQTIFNILIALSIVFFVLIVLTHSYVRWLEYTKTAELTEIDNKIKIQEEAYKRFILAKNGAKQAINTVILNETSKNLTTVPTQTINLGTQISGKELENKSSLDKTLENRFKKAAIVLNRSVLGPLNELMNNETIANTLPDTSSKVFSVANNSQLFNVARQLSPLYHTVINNINNSKVLKTPLNLSESQSGQIQPDESTNVTSVVFLNKIANNTISRVNSDAELFLQNAELELGKLRAQRAMIKNDLVAANKTLNELSTQLQQYETPLGQIPIGVEKAIDFFPISIAVGFLILAYTLSDTIRLRMQYHYSFRINDSQQHLLDDVQIYHTAPIWLDPLSGRLTTLLKWGILLIPCIICVLAISVIVYTWTIIPSITTVDRFNQLVYAISFGFSLGLIGYGIVLIRKQMSRYYIREIKKDLIDYIKKLTEDNKMDKQDAQKLNTILWKAMYEAINGNTYDAKVKLMEFSNLLSARRGARGHRIRLDNTIRGALDTSAQKAKRKL
jgi:hypothetical protein